MVAALREAGRVARPGAPVVIQVFGRPERCDLEAVKAVMRPFLPAPPLGAPSTPKLWQPGVLDEMVAAAGLNVRGAFDFSYATDYPDEQTLGRPLMAPAGIAKLVGPARERRCAGRSSTRSSPSAALRARIACRTSFTTSSPRAPEAAGDVEPAPYDRSVIDQSTEFGARVARHLREEIVIWMTTVTPAGSPLPMPVWFLWDGAESVVMYSRPGARVRNIEANPRVALNFHGDGRGGDIVVLSGNAAVDDGAPPADRARDYRAKYDEHIARIGMSPEAFVQRYSVPVRIQLTRLRGH